MRDFWFLLRNLHFSRRARNLSVYLFPFCIWSVDVSAASGVIEIYSTPANAQVFIDNRLVGTTPYSNPEIKPGEHQVKVVLEGEYEPQYWHGIVDQITPQVSHFIFQKKSKSHWGNADSTDSGNSREVGNIQFASIPTGTRIYIDGEQQGSTPSGFTDIAEGRYQVEFISDEGRSLSGDFDIIRGETIKIIANFNDDAIHNRWREQLRAASGHLLADDERTTSEMSTLAAELKRKEQLVTRRIAQALSMEREVSARETELQRREQRVAKHEAVLHQLVTRSGKLRDIGPPDIIRPGSNLDSDSMGKPPLESNHPDSLIRSGKGPGQLASQLVWPALTPGDSGHWQLGLNIKAIPSSNPPIKAELFTWEDVHATMKLVDRQNKSHSLEVNIEMTGAGQRDMTGKSLFRRISRYDYKFAFTVLYSAYFDGELISSASRNIDSINAREDRRGNLISDWFNDHETAGPLELDAAVVSLTFGCIESTSGPASENTADRIPGVQAVTSRNNQTIQTNINPSQKSLAGLNRYLCLDIQMHTHK